MENAIPKESWNHLNAGVSPIRVCLYDSDDDSEENKRELESDIKIFKNKDTKKVDWFGKDIEEKDSYRQSVFNISNIDDRNKMSDYFMQCTSLIVSGVTKDGKNVSFLTHQNPGFVRQENLGTIFAKSLKEKIEEVKKICLPGTIDAVYLGGLNTGGENSNSDYLLTLNYINTTLKDILGFGPTVVNGRKIIPGSNGVDTIYYDNQNRRVYFIRPKVNSKFRDTTIY